jgi:hypothetical protein
VTTIDFYTHVDDRLAIAARIVAKAAAALATMRAAIARRSSTCV